MISLITTAFTGDGAAPLYTTGTLLLAPGTCWCRALTPTTLNVLLPGCSGTVATQLLTVVHRTNQSAPFTEIVLTSTGAVPLSTPTPLLTVTEEFTVNGDATVASCDCRAARR